MIMQADIGCYDARSVSLRTVLGAKLPRLGLGVGAIHNPACVKNASQNLRPSMNFDDRAR
jgi:hypothetical protein